MRVAKLPTPAILEERCNRVDQQPWRIYAVIATLREVDEGHIASLALYTVTNIEEEGCREVKSLEQRAKARTFFGA